jgi:DNA-3-methyladenine glycosylase II
MNLETAKKHLSQDHQLAKVMAEITLPDLNPNGDAYYSLLESIVSQQLSVKVADVIFGRFVKLFPDEYPEPKLLIAKEIEELRSVGLSQQKANYFRNVALFFEEHMLNQRDWSVMSDDEIIDFLSQIKGVGKWTVQMLLMFTIKRPDIFPIDDLGIQQGMVKLYQLEETGKDLKKKMLEISENWKPYRTTASRFIWRWKDTKIVAN